MSENISKNIENSSHFQIYNRFPITLVRGQDSRVWDSDGKEYIDALAGIAVNSLGHCHIKIVNAIKEQAEKLIHCSNLYYNEPQSQLADLLCKYSGLDRVFFCNSGAEATEASIKLLRAYGNKRGRKGSIISFSNSFHGRTLAAVAMGKKKYQEGFEPMPIGFEVLPFNSIDSLSKIDNDTLGVQIEPIQGEGGVVAADKEFLIALRKKCDETGAVLVFDEIQCGMGRTGHLFAWEYFGVKPDVITIAKALGGGVPIGAMIAKEEIAQSIAKGKHGTTFGGNPLACAAGVASINALIEENIPTKAKSMGLYFHNELKKIAQQIEEIIEVRGVGLMIGVVLDMNCSDVVKRMLEKGVLANCTADFVIRLLPPLNIAQDDIDTIVKVLSESIIEISRELR